MGQSTTIFELAQSFGGLFGESAQFRTGSDEPRLRIRISRLGDISQVWSHAGGKPPGHFPLASADGSGTALEEAECLLPSLAEGLERYCTSIFASEQFVTATAAELGSAALDLTVIPRCSSRELSHPRCPLVAPDATLPIRWVRALSLLSGDMVFVPAIMVYLYTGYDTPGERIWIPITTGCAAHRSYERALLAAILEVIERDAISLVWLQKLPLPRIEIDRFSPQLATYWDHYQKGSSDLEYFFFDATTDLGVPTVYGVQVSATNKRVTTLVSCSSAMDPAEAIVKVMRDMGSCRIPFRRPREVPANWDNFTDLFHGAAYMARAERASAFDFLVKTPNRRLLSSIACLDDTDERRALDGMLTKLRSKGLDAYAVDLSSDEALRAGFRVVRVLIPGLQPFSFQYRARYLGHPRLYEAPRLMGYPVHSEEQLSPWPQPFA
jgi:ribosomal protein S12 methylthiotransferase accessory factor